MAKTYQDLLQRKKQQIKNIDLNDADRLRREGAVLIDIREADEVEQGDALSYLERQPDASVGALAAIQVVEHFDPAYLVRFLDAAFHKMTPGAPLVLETINAACWMAFFETYIRDLTHQRPLHPDTLRYLVEASGFSSVDIRFREPVSAGDRLLMADPGHPGGGVFGMAAVVAAVNDHANKLNTRLFSSMDYAVIARR